MSRVRDLTWVLQWSSIVCCFFQKVCFLILVPFQESTVVSVCLGKEERGIDEIVASTEFIRCMQRRRDHRVISFASQKGGDEWCDKYMEEFPSL